MLEMFRSLRYKNYRLFFIGQSISLIGTWMQRIAVSWLVYRITNSAILLGVVSFSGQIPSFILAPIAGVFADRFNRYRLIVLMQILAMLQALILAVLVLTNTVSIPSIIVLSIFLGIINAFDIPTRQAFVTEMIDKKNHDLGNAIALNSSIVNGARLLGPSLAGILIASFGEGICFLINGLSYFAVLASLMQMNISYKKASAHSENIFNTLKEGFFYVLRNIHIKNIILLLALISLMGMPYNVLMPVFAKQILHGGSHTLGFLMAASGGGSLIGAIYLASRKHSPEFIKIIPIAAGIFGISLILLSFTSNFTAQLSFSYISSSL